MHASVRLLASSLAVTGASLAQPAPNVAPPPSQEAIDTLLAAHALERPAPGESILLEQRIGHTTITDEGKYELAETTLIREVTEDDFLDVEQLGATELIPYHYSGDPATRFDIVIVGDGYRGVDTATFFEHLDNVLSLFLDASPFSQYLDGINIWGVRAGTQATGVDHDPVFPIWRSTAIDMNFWCADIESLLCVDVIKTFGYAGRAPSSEQVIAMANSTKYGGAVYYSTDVFTISGGHPASPHLLLSQFAQVFANLAVEYESPGFAYRGGEPSLRNVSIYNASQLAAFQWKWHRWLGVNDPAHNGLHSAFEGAYGYEFDIYRPTADSRMRTAGKPFNLPSAESFVLEMYRFMKPIQSVTPPTTVILFGNETLEVDAIQTNPWSPEFKWFIDGVEIPDRIGPSLDLSEFSPPVGAVITVRVVDPSPLVRDEALRAERMTEERSWTIADVPCQGDASANGVVDMSDLASVLENWRVSYAPGTGAGDANRDQVVDFNDITTVLGHWLDECP